MANEIKMIRPSNKKKLKMQKTNEFSNRDNGTTQLKSIGKALVICVFYMVVGPSLIINNKYILYELNFAFPIVVSSMGVVSTALFTHLLVYFNVAALQPSSTSTITRSFYLRNIFPVGFCLALTLAFGNAVYLYLSVSFIQMLKAFTPVIVLVSLYVSGIETPRKEITVCVVLIALGTALNCAGSKDYSIYGVLLMLAAEVCESTKLVMTQFLLKNKKFTVVEGQYYIAPISVVCLFILSLFTEFPTLFTEENYEIFFSNLSTFILSAFLGIAVNYAAFLVVQATNSVTLKVLGTVRNALLIVFQVFYAGDQITKEQGFAYALTLVAFSFYNYFKLTGGNEGNNKKYERVSQEEKPTA